MLASAIIASVKGVANFFRNLKEKNSPPNQERKVYLDEMKDAIKDQGQVVKPVNPDKVTRELGENRDISAI